jgi:hypothetical protein
MERIVDLDEHDLKKLPCKGRCMHQKEQCGKVKGGEAIPYHCTLPKDHEGRHIACGAMFHGYVEWD